MYNVNTSCNWDGSYTALAASNRAESTEGTNALTNVAPLSTLAYLSTGFQSTFDLSSSPVYFYVFPNGDKSNPSGYTYPTKLIIKGIWKDKSSDATGEVVYYPIIINHSQAGTTIKIGNTTYTNGATYSDDKMVIANTQYALTATIKGKGVSNVSDNINPAAISLMVSVNPWNTTSQDVTFE